MNFLGRSLDFIKGNLLQIEANVDDVLTLPFYTPVGVYSIPKKNDKVLVLSCGNKKILVSIGSNPKNNLEDLKPLEVKIKSESASLFLNNDGEIIFNDGTDYAVKYSELETAFNSLQNKYNTLINILSTWVPVPTDGGTALKTAILGAGSLSSSADISLAKNEMVKL